MTAATMKIESAAEMKFPFDPVISIAALLLLLAGVVMVGSASTEVAASSFGSSWHT